MDSLRKTNIYQSIRQVYKKLTFTNRNAMLDQQILSVAFYFIIATGICLAIYQFLLGHSLWLDEAMLALNIIRRNFGELLKPLDYQQVAPIGFLFIEKIFTLVFGKHDFSLRIFPLISSLVSIPLYYLFVYQLTQSRVITLLATSMFSISNVFVKYATQAKQYPVDMFCAVAILYFSFRLRLQSRQSLVLFTLLGSIILWFSNVSVIMLFVIGLYLLYSEAYLKRNFKIFFVLPWWVLSFVVYYVLIIYAHPHTQFMQDFWQDAFLSIFPPSLDTGAFLIHGSEQVLSILGFGPFWFIPLAVLWVAVGFLIKERNLTLLFVCFTPIFVHLVLSAIKLYPFAGKLFIYFTPLLLLLFSVGIYRMFELVQKKVPKLPSLVLILPVLIMFYPLSLDFPHEKEEVKSSLMYLEQNIRDGDTIYIYSSTNPVFDFYTETEFPESFTEYKIVMGEGGHREDYTGHNDELLNLDGKVWMLFSHVYQNEEKYMLGVLLSNGSEIIDVQKYTGSSVYYIDTKK